MIKWIKKIKYLEHYALWVFMFLFVFDYHYWDSFWKAISITAAETSFYMLVFYFNYWVALPYLLDKKREFLYFVAIFAFLFPYILLLKGTGLEAHIFQGGFWRNIASMFINFSLFWLISTLFWYYKKLLEARERELKARAAKLEMEIKFLKKQISPHFIFNTLNNIYSLIHRGHKNAGPMLAKLSKILRYALYDGAQETVLLESELNLIQQYIDLQLLKEPKSENVDFYREGNTAGKKIVPLILLNFIENCFKHSGLESSENAWIKVHFFINEEKLVFKTENSVANSKAKKQGNGLGNQNIIRQLELHYPNSHELLLLEENGVFTAKITFKNIATGAVPRTQTRNQ